MELVLVLTSDRVSERQQAFTPMFCRQLIWALVEDGRAYFAQHMSVDDFVGVHADDIVYPESTANELKPHIRNQSPIFRSSFPQQWLTSTAEQWGSTTGPARNQHHGVPIINVSTGTGTVVSGMSATTAAPSSTQRPLVYIRDTTHPKIKTAFSAYIQKFGSVRLIQLLQSLNQTVADLPTLPSLPADTSLCYNYILGRCVHSGCQHKHVPAEEVPDDFAAALVTLLQPAVTNFMTNGAPPPFRRRKRRRGGGGGNANE